MSAKVVTNLESLGDLIGSLKGMGDAMERDEYIDSLVRQAHETASKDFDIATAATAGAGFLTHMFEFGVPGITPGKARFSDPTAPEARLWVHKFHGGGGKYDASFTFRPAMQPNPRPTVASTGVSSKYLAKLSRRKQVFWNKAYVMETGQTVSIKAKNSDFIFVPFRGEASRDPKNKKGFVMYNTTKLGPITAQPGRNSKGSFTAFWTNWWNSAGSTIMETNVNQKVKADVSKAGTEMTRTAANTGMKPVQTTNIQSAVNTSRARMKKNFGTGREGGV